MCVIGRLPGDSMRKRFLVAVSVLGLVAACGDKSTDKPMDSTGSSMTAAVPPSDSGGSATTASHATHEPAAANTYTITAKEFAFTAPDTIPAGMITLKLVNGGTELHHVQLLKLSDGKTFADFNAAMKAMKPGSPPPPWIHEVAGPNSPAPGGDQSITEKLDAGNYVLACFIPGADHVPHVMKGMVKSLTVIPSATPAEAAPKADITVKMTDYAWEITPAISAGKHVIKIENAATQAHEMFIAKLEPGKTPADLVKWVETMQGPPPAKPMGGISGMTIDAAVYLYVDLPPGQYGLFCFLNDSKDGKMHVEHGMVRQITVK